jgi:tetratricopeptide (TPR) repeat protein
VILVNPEVDEALDQALAMVERGNVQTGEKIIRALHKRYPRIHTAQFAMGVVCGIKGQHDQAIAYFEKAIEIFPYFVEAWFNKGASHQKRHEPGEMIRAYQRVVEIGDPAQDFVQHARDVLQGVEQKIRKDLGLSLTAYLQGMDKFKVAFAAMEKMQWEDALRGLQQVLAIDPRHKQSYGNMGICYGQLGRKAEALEALDKVLELDPAYEPALLNRRLVSTLQEGQKLQ